MQPGQIRQALSRFGINPQVLLDECVTYATNFIRTLNMASPDDQAFVVTLIHAVLDEACRNIRDSGQTTDVLGKLVTPLQDAVESIANRNEIKIPARSCR